MMAKKSLYSFFLAPLLITVFINCTNKKPDMVTDCLSDVESVMDDWHNAAAEADFERYFGHFADSSSIFMGTDATERWNMAEFKAFSKPYFDRGRAWNFTPLTRHIYISENGNTAWFDEELSTPNLGPSRGTGVLVLNKEGWKIAHYSLTVPIPNPIMDDVKNQIEKELNKN